MMWPSMSPELLRDRVDCLPGLGGWEAVPGQLAGRPEGPPSSGEQDHGPSPSPSASPSAGPVPVPGPGDSGGLRVRPCRSSRLFAEEDLASSTAAAVAVAAIGSL